MTPQRFAASNIVMLAPQGMDNCSDVHAWSGDIGKDPYVITAWRPSPAELVKINLGEPVFLFVCGRTMPPVLVTVDNPFQE